MRPKNVIESDTSSLPARAALKFSDSIPWREFRSGAPGVRTSPAQQDEPIEVALARFGQARRITVARGEEPAAQRRAAEQQDHCREASTDSEFDPGKRDHHEGQHVDEHAEPPCHGALKHVLAAAAGAVAAERTAEGQRHLAENARVGEAQLPQPRVAPANRHRTQRTERLQTTITARLPGSG